MNWLYHLWYGYLIPSLWGNGPEAIAQTVVYGIIALVLIPPIRKAVEKFAKRHIESLKAHITKAHADSAKAIHARLDAMEKSHNAIHDKLDILLGSDDAPG